VRDPTPRKGLLEFLDVREMNAMEAANGNDGKSSYIQMVVAHEQSAAALEKYRWLELYVVCAHGQISLYRPECMVTGFTAADALASIPVDEIYETAIDPTIGILDFYTKARVYRFRSQQQGEVAKWMHDVMMNATPGMERFWDDDDDFDDEEEEASIWQLINRRKATNGGLESALSKPADKLEAAEEGVLQSLFNTISQADDDKDDMVAGDLIRWAGTRMNMVTDKKQLNKLLEMVTAEACDAAIKDSLALHDEDSDGRVTFGVFKQSMCTYGSPLRKVVLAMLDTFPGMERWEYLQAVVGQLSKSDYLLMYHSHMVNVQRACRKQLNDKTSDSETITNNAKIAEIYLTGVLSEVNALVQKKADYIKKLHGMAPSLRERVHTYAIDDIFDELNPPVPGKRWEETSPKQSWA